MQYIQELYEKYEYEEVGSPNIYNFKLWETSGHAAHYKENMFVFQVEKQEYGLKPMNCPGVLVHTCATSNILLMSVSSPEASFADNRHLHQSRTSVCLSVNDEQALSTVHNTPARHCVSGTHCSSMTSCRALQGTA